MRVGVKRFFFIEQIFFKNNNDRPLGYKYQLNKDVDTILRDKLLVITRLLHHWRIHLIVQLI